MSNNKKRLFDPNMAPLTYFSDDDFYADDELEFKKLSFGERAKESLKEYWRNSKSMIASSTAHLRSPSTIIVIFLLIAVYVLLGVAGKIGFSFYNNNTVKEITTSLDIIVNALFGFFYGPITCCISMILCCIVKMITSGDGVFIGYIIGSAVAGFLHGWILYRNKTAWFGTRFRGFYTDLCLKAFMVRFVVSAFVNIFLMAIVYKLLVDYPIYAFIMHYSKSKVELTAFSDFFTIFFVNLFFESLIVFVALAVVDFIVVRAFPSLTETPSLMIDEDGELISLEEEFLTGAVPVPEDE